jgi:hypothetical protein
MNVFARRSTAKGPPPWLGVVAGLLMCAALAALNLLLI